MNMTYVRPTSFTRGGSVGLQYFAGLFISAIDIWMAIGPSKDILQSMVAHDLVYPMATSKVYKSLKKKKDLLATPAAKGIFKDIIAFVCRHQLYKSY